MSTTPIIRIEHLTKTYTMGTTHVHALRGISLEIQPGEMVAIMGPSGSGKSTLMNIIGCLDRPTDGSYWLEGLDVAQMDDDRLAEVRNARMGFVFQQFNLLPRTRALRQVELPMLYSGEDNKEARARAALAAVGLEDRGSHKPAEMSGGQQQRVAIARALVNDPAIIMADEPTGALDTRTGQEVLAIFQRLNREGKTILMVTHEYDVGQHCKRVVRFKDGHIIADEPVENPLDALEELARLPRYRDEDEEDEL